jgi:hypothetical protein
MYVGTTAKDVAATLGDMVTTPATAVVVDMAVVVKTIEDMAMGIDQVMDMDIETVVTLGTILATEIQVTDMAAKTVGATIVAAIKVVIMVAVTIVTHAQGTNLEIESTAAKR